MRSPIANCKYICIGAPYTDIFLAIPNTITQSDTINKFDLKQYQLTLVEICFKMGTLSNVLTNTFYPYFILLPPGLDTFSSIVTGDFSFQRINSSLKSVFRAETVAACL